MQGTRSQARLVALAAALFVAAAIPSAVSAQSSLAVSDAEGFMGSWDLMLDTDQGAFGMDLIISDMDGMVGVRVDMPDVGGGADVTDVTKDGDNLVLSYSLDAQGQMVPVSMTLTPAGEDLEAEVDFADGMFVAFGTATRAN